MHELFQVFNERCYIHARRQDPGDLVTWLFVPSKIILKIFYFTSLIGIILCMNIICIHINSFNIIEDADAFLKRVIIIRAS